MAGGKQGRGLWLSPDGVQPADSLVGSKGPVANDNSGMAHDRISGWPQWLHRVKGDEATKVLETSAYFDAVNFARKYKGKSLMGVGFIDTACSPTSVYSAFNALPDPKAMIAGPSMGHGTDPRYTQACDEFWKKHLPLKTPSGKE